MILHIPQEREQTINVLHEAMKVTVRPLQKCGLKGFVVKNQTTN